MMLDLRCRHRSADDVCHEPTRALGNASDVVCSQCPLSDFSGATDAELADALAHPHPCAECLEHPDNPCAGCDGHHAPYDLPTDDPVPQLPMEIPASMTDAIRHLSYHLWPTTHGDAWRWNLDQLAQRWSLFNGSRILGLQGDRHSHSTATVLDYCRDIGLDWDEVIERRNMPSLGEVRTWQPRMEALRPESAGPDDMLFCAHGKGVKYPGEQMPDVIRLWAETMYQVNLDNWPAVAQALSRHPVAGAFKRYDGFPGLWHYSGTFFWVRLQDVGQRNWRVIDKNYAGVEMWPGRHFPAHEGYCLFHDHCGPLYLQQYWDDTVLPALRALPLLLPTDY